MREGGIASQVGDPAQRCCVPHEANTFGFPARFPWNCNGGLYSCHASWTTPSGPWRLQDWLPMMESIGMWRLWLWEIVKCWVLWGWLRCVLFPNLKWINLEFQSHSEFAEARETLRVTVKVTKNTNAYHCSFLLCFFYLFAQ